MSIYSKHVVEISVYEEYDAQAESGGDAELFEGQRAEVYFDGKLLLFIYSDGTHSYVGNGYTSETGLKSLYDYFEAKTKRIATEHGKASASWVFDGNMPDEQYRHMLKGLTDGDPEVYARLPRSPLSGGRSDGYSVRQLLKDVGLPEDFEDLDWVTDAYEAEWHDALVDEVVRIAREHLEV